jgi:hypothetical protein
MDEARKLSSDSEGSQFGSHPSFDATETAEVPGFIPTKQELKQIIAYWVHWDLFYAFFYFQTGSSGSDEMSVGIYACRRRHSAAKLLSEREIDEVVEQAHRDFKYRLKISDHAWDIFMHGTEEQWDAYQEQWNRGFDEACNRRTKETDSKK